jgi:hypothetical protein
MRSGFSEAITDSLISREKKTTPSLSPGHLGRGVIKLWSLVNVRARKN